MTYEQLNTSSITSLLSKVAFILLLLIGSTSCSTHHERHNINLLVIHSFEEDLVTYPEMNRHIKHYIETKGIEANIHTVYLDCDAKLESGENQFIYDLLDTLTIKPDYILATDDQASYALMSCQHPLSKQIPSVFTGVNFPNYERLKHFTNITGIQDKLDLSTNVEMIENLLGFRQIRMYYDKTYLGKKTLKLLCNQLGDRDTVLRTRIEEFLSPSYTMSTIRAIEADSTEKSRSFVTKYTRTKLRLVSLRYESGGLVLGYLNGLFPNSVSLLTRYDYTLSRIGNIARNPTFTAINKEFGHDLGVLGGYFTTTEDLAKEACDYLVQLIKGKPITSLPIKESKKTAVLDWLEMERWGIPRSAVENDYKIVNMPFYVKYQTPLIISAILLGATIIFIITYLLFLFTRENKRKLQAQQSLREEKEFLSLVLEGGNIFAWSYRHDSETFTFDKEFATSVGLKNEHLTLTDMIAFTHPDDVENALTEFIKIVSHKEERATISVRLKFYFTNYTWYEFRMLCLPKRENNSASIVGVILSIQDFKEYEEELIAARDLAAKTELKQSFLANMSHEIRTPLNAIVGFSNILVADDSLNEEERKDFISTINVNCELLLKLINDILEISRIESGNLSFNFEEFSVNKLIDDIYQMNCFLAPPSVSFIKETLSDDIVLSSDMMRLKQVLVNFVNNAFKFTKEGHVKVGVSHEKNSQEICLYVEDTGLGIPAEEQKMIFERFYKQDQFSQGTGLGLSISNVIAEKLNGRITLISEENRGSRFGIMLPCLTKCDTDDESQTVYFSEGTESSSTNDNRPTILIAEDSASNYMVLSRTLKKHYNIVWALNGTDALNALNTQSIDLVLMDIKMPEMDGITALKKIRKFKKKLPIIIQTAYAFEENRELAIKAGCNEFIEKPIHTDELLITISKYLPADNNRAK